MHTVTIHEAKTHLSRLLHECSMGQTVVIARNNTPVARLVPLSKPALQRRLGGAKGTLVSIAKDFDTPLEDFKEYME